MPRFGGLLPIVLALAVVCLLSGSGSCARDASPELVQVTDLAPREVEVGDRLAVVGDGFPPGKPARVTFRGTLHRPGERPERDAEIVTDGTVVGPRQVEVVFTETTRAQFCRAGDRAAHTTFEGDLEVAFAAASPGAPPIAGVLHQVTLDARPPAAAADAARERDGERVLGWMGVHATAGPSGLAVDSVDPGSRADAAGIAPGDVLTSFDGVRVASAGDVLPLAGERDADVVVRRGDPAVEVARVVSVDGFRRAPLEELLAAALIVLGALGIVVLFAAPTSGILSAPVRRVVSRIRARAGHGLGEAVRDVLPPAGPFALADGLACALLAAMPFGQYLIAARLDVALLFVAAATSLAASAFVASRTAWQGARAAAHVVWQHVPAAAAILIVVLATGSLRVQEIDRAQGAWPWEWLAFRSPAAIVALVLLLSAGRIEPDAPDAPAGLASLVDPPATFGRRVPWLDAACRAHRLLVAGLASVLLLGGWLLPGLTAAEQNAHLALQLAGAVWMLGKTTLLALLLAWLRRVMPRLAAAERTRATALWTAPLSVAAIVAALAWTWWGPAGSVQRLVSGALVTGVVLGAAALVQRIRHGVLSPTGDARLSPFL